MILLQQVFFYLYRISSSCHDLVISLTEAFIPIDKKASPQHDTANNMYHGRDGEFRMI